MKYCELQPTLQNLKNEIISVSKIAEVLGESRQTMHKRITSAKGDVTAEDIKLLEEAFGVSLVDKIVIDYYPDVFASCGNGSILYSPNKIQTEIPKSAFFTDFTSIKVYSMFNVFGNSMEPFIMDRDRIIIEHWNGEQIVDNRPYYFCYKNELFVKRLAKNINQLMIIPENKDYDVIKLTGEDMNDVHIIGQVVGLMRDLR